MDSPNIPGSFRFVVYVPISNDGTPANVPESILGEGHRPISICCPDTGDRCSIEHGPSLADFAAGQWVYKCPSCGEDHQQRYGRAALDDPYYRRTIDIPFDLDLGELVQGQHIVLRGIQLRTTSGSVLHYSFVPGFRRDDRELDTSWGSAKWAMISEASTTTRAAAVGVQTLMESSEMATRTSAVASLRRLAGWKSNSTQRTTAGQPVRA